jgi:hypothetical protein
LILSQRFDGGLWARGSSRWAFASLTLALLSYCALVIEWTGVLHQDCGQWDLNCAAYGVLVLAIGCIPGTFAALASFESNSHRSFSWLVLLLNGVPGVPSAALVLWFLGK